MEGRTYGKYSRSLSDGHEEVALENGAYLIDLNELSMVFFSGKGRDYATLTYFMNFLRMYEAYPGGSK
jgi:hypothetical protein